MSRVRRRSFPSPRVKLGRRRFCPLRRPRQRRHTLPSSKARRGCAFLSLWRKKGEIFWTIVIDFKFGRRLFHYLMVGKELLEGVTASNPLKTMLQLVRVWRAVGFYPSGSSGKYTGKYKYTGLNTCHPPPVLVLFVCLISQDKRYFFSRWSTVWMSLFIITSISQTPVCSILSHTLFRATIVHPLSSSMAWRICFIAPAPMEASPSFQSSSNVEVYSDSSKSVQIKHCLIEFLIMDSNSNV